MSAFHTARPGPARDTPTPGTFRIGNLFRFPIRIHWSWLIAFVLVSWTLQSGYLPTVYPEWTAERRWAAGILTSVLFFGSVLAHELAHALQARRRGYPVHHITLFIFGGVSAVGDESRTARDEFWIAFVGPLTSLGLAVAFAGVWFATRAAGVEPLYPIAGYLAVINAMLGVFNLLPGFPLDGGRVLRALVWGARGSLLDATRIAAVAGRVVAGLLVVAGLATIVGGNIVSGVWFMLIGWFLWGAAEGAYRDLLLRTSLQGASVDALLERDVPRVAPDLTLRQFMQEHVLPQNRRAFFVAPAEGGDVLGMITVTDLQRVPEADWDRISVYRAMTPRDRLVAVAPGCDALMALRLMAERQVTQLPVFAGREPVGLVTQAALAQAIHLRATTRTAA